MKKNLFYFVLMLILIFPVFNNKTLVFATSTSNQTSELITYTKRNEFSGEYINLENISNFDIQNNTLVYYTVPNLVIYNLKTHSIELTTNQFNNIKFLKLHNNLIFILNNNKLSIFNYLTNKIENPIGFTFPNNISTIDIISNSQEIKICYISNKILTRITLNKDLKFISKSETITQIANYVGELSISNTYAFVNCGDSENLNKLFKIDLETTSIPGSNAYSYFPIENCFKMQYFNLNSNEYLIALFPNKIAIIKTNLEQNVKADFETGSNTANDNGIFELGIINTPTDIKCYDSLIYLSDSKTKSIQTFKLENNSENNKAILKGNSIICASEFGNIGWFSLNSNFTINNENIYVADNKNNRIQTIKNGLVKSYSTNYFPKNIEAFNNSVLFTSKISKDSKFNVLNILNNENITQVTKILNNKEYKEINEIYSATIDNLGNYYAISGNNIIKYEPKNSTHFISVKENFTNFNQNSFIKFLNDYNSFLIYSNNILYLTDSSFSILNSITIGNAKSICTSLNKIFILTNDSKILKYSIQNNKNDLYINFESELKNDYLNDINFININKNSGLIYGFNNKKCSIDAIINCEFNLVKSNKKIITLNKNVYIYNKPTKLPIPQSLKPEIIKSEINTIGTLLDLYSEEEIIYEGNNFYSIMFGNKICYLNVNDVDFFTNEKIVKYKPSNATLKGENEINVYSTNEINENKIFYKLKPNSKIITIDYNESNKLTKIQFYDDLKQLQEGYVETTLINTYNLSRAEILAITLISVSIPIAITLLILYVKISKNKTNKKYK